jgi:DNA-directed RNA polymerase subunit RPC12/RpoP
MSKETGLVRTDMYCHDCGKNFIATLDFDLDGDHEIECPSCAHIHYRKIIAGVVTGERHDSDQTIHKVEKRHIWKSTTQPIVTSTASMYIRDLWLNRSDIPDGC